MEEKRLTLGESYSSKITNRNKRKLKVWTLQKVFLFQSDYAGKIIIFLFITKNIYFQLNGSACVHIRYVQTHTL